MTEDFLTMGLQSDRYLKAVRLVDQFETEIEAILQAFDERMVDQHPELFDPDTRLTVGSKRHPGSLLGYHRINHSMNGPRAPTDDRSQALNVHLYWAAPTDYNRTDVSGVLRAFGYKIKDAPEEIDTHVVEQTRTNDWAVETSGNPYDSNKVFYNHVSSRADIEDTVDTLVDHFSEFGDEYAAKQDFD